MNRSLLRTCLAFMTLALSPATSWGAYTIWSTSTSTSASGTLLVGGNSVGVTYSYTNGTSADTFVGISSSSTFGTFYGGQTTATIYTPAPPGTNDFVRGIAGSNTALYTVTFSQAVVNPIFEVFNLDFRSYNFLNNVSVTVLSGLNLVATGSVAADNDGGATYDNGGSDPNKGNPNGSAYGSFQLNGTFTSIQWNRLDNVNTRGFTDGNDLGIASAASAVPEPSSLVLCGIALPLGLAMMRRRRRASC